jgi:hypothetical protein
LIPTNCGKQGKQDNKKYLELEIMTPLCNISLSKILEKIACMFMKQRCGHTFQPIKGCFALTCIKRYKLNEQVSNIAMHGQGEEANVPKFMINWIFV